MVVCAALFEEVVELEMAAVLLVVLHRNHRQLPDRSTCNAGSGLRRYSKTRSRSGTSCGRSLRSSAPRSDTMSISSLRLLRPTLRAFGPRPDTDCLYGRPEPQEQLSVALLGTHRKFAPCGRPCCSVDSTLRRTMGKSDRSDPLALS